MSGPKNLTESLAPLLFWYAFIGHGVFRFPAHRPRIVFSVIFAIICVVLYLSTLAFTMNTITNAPWYGDGERVVFVIIYVSAAIAVIDAMLSWSNAKRFALIIEDMTKVDETLQELGASFNYSRARYEGYALIVFCIAMIGCFNWVDTLWFHNVVSTSQAYKFVSVLHHPVHINTIVAFQFCLSVRLIGIRYKKANAVLERLARSIVPTEINMSKIPRNKIIIGSAFPIPSFWTRQVLKTTQNRKYLIQIIKHVHLQLGKAGKDLNKAFGVQMALETTAMFTMFIGLLFELYILASRPLAFDRDSRACVVGTWIVVYFLKLIVINDVCERVCVEARRTAEIITSINEKNGDPEMPDELKQFSVQLFHDPLVFSPGEFVTLGHQFITKFMATVTTYLVILIQMTPPKFAKAGSRY